MYAAVPDVLSTSYKVDKNVSFVTDMNKDTVLLVFRYIKNKRMANSDFLII